MNEDKMTPTPSELSGEELDALETRRRLATPGWHANPVNPYSVTSSQSHPIWTLSDDFHRQCMHGTGQDREYLLALYDAAPRLINAARNQAPTPSGEGFSDPKDHALTASGEMWSDLPIGKRFGRHLTEDAVPLLKPGTLLRMHSNDPWFNQPECVDHGEILVFTGNVSNAFPLVGPHLEVAHLNGSVIPGGGWVYRLFQFVADPQDALAALALPPAGIEGSEPVAWLCEGGRERMISMDPKDAAWWRDHGFNVTPLGPLYAHPPQTQGQVSAQDGSGLSHDDLKRLIADGFSGGNQTYDEASEPQRSRYDMAADAVLSARVRSALERGTAGGGEG